MMIMIIMMIKIIIIRPAGWVGRSPLICCNLAILAICCNLLQSGGVSGVSGVSRVSRFLSFTGRVGSGRVGSHLP